MDPMQGTTDGQHRPRANAGGRPWLRIAGWVLVLVAVVDLVALKAGGLAHPPALLAVIVGLAAVALAARAGVLVRSLLRRPAGSAVTAAELLATAGVLVALGGGTANWLLSLQGYAILYEGESARLREGAQLQAFEAGPLARIDESDVVVTLDELQLLPRGNGRFDPSSRLRIWRSHERFDELGVTPHQAGESGALRFHQGAFGFAPRITIVQQGESVREVFDKVVPFVTERHGPDGLSFHGEFEITEERLEVIGRVDLASLDEGMRGHATLWLDVSQGGAKLGGGALLPGHFADIDRGFRIGFTGLQRWSEIVISRRNYAQLMKVGAVIMATGLLLWPLAAWRSR